MLAYLATKEQFLKDAPVIEDIVKDNVYQKLNLRVGESEFNAWRNSLGNAMAHVMHSDKIPSDSGVAIEYRLNGRKFRLDFVVAGTNAQGKESIAIVELKQWTQVDFSDLDEHVQTPVGGGLRDLVHPAYQAWSYRSHLELYNEYVYSNEVNVASYAYLHNCRDTTVINNSRYEEALQRSPVFLHGESAKLIDSIADQIKSGPGTSILERIDEGKIRPSAQLAESVGKMLEGNQEFVLLDEQKTAYEQIILNARSAIEGKKTVTIVKGGPGTGKSVIAVNALAALTGERLSAKYLTANAAPRDVFAAKLKGLVKGDAVRHLFGGTGSYTETEENSVDVLVVDEAHRLRMKSGMFRNLGEDQTGEIIRSAKSSVFFIDEAQKVTWSDVGEIDHIKAWAKKLGAEVSELELVSQFRCGGSDDYMAWIDHVLGVAPASDSYFSPASFDFRIFEEPQEMHTEIARLNEINNRARVVAGYCWNWVSDKDSKKFDIEIGGYKARWNLKSYGNEWIMNPNSASEVGCIHTCQGLEVDYIGVIVGRDLVVREGRLVTDPSERARTDASLKGFKKEAKDDPISATRKADEIIRNTYRTLMTRGMKGCFVYFEDKETAAYFQDLLNRH